MRAVHLMIGLFVVGPVLSDLRAQGLERPADGSTPGTVLLVIAEHPSGARVTIVREPKYLGHRQRSAIFFPADGTPEELALALASFDRIRSQDGDTIMRTRTETNIGVVRAASSNPTKDAANKPYRDAYLLEMRSLLALVNNSQAQVLEGVGYVKWIEVDRPGRAK